MFDNLISGSRSWAETQIFHTNSARRTCWNLSRSLLDCYVLRSLVSEIHKNIHYLWLKQKFPPSQNWTKDRVWEFFLQFLISESRSRAKTCGSSTNSARRVHWYPFCPKKSPHLSETWFLILGVGAPFSPYGVA